MSTEVPLDIPASRSNKAEVRQNRPFLPGTVEAEPRNLRVNPANLDFDVPSLSETGLSQDLESHHLSQSGADTVPLSVELDSQSGDAGQENGTPGTSFTDPGAAKKRKGRK